MLGLLLAGGLWFFHFAGPKPSPEEEQPEETRRIDFTTRFEDLRVGDGVQPETDEADSRPVAEDEDIYLADEMISDDFSGRLAEKIFNAYIPAGPAGGPGRFALTFKQVNMNYAVDLTGFRVDQEDILRGRQEVLGHLLQPVVIRSATSFYGPRLLDRIQDLAQTRIRTIPSPAQPQERVLTRYETAELFRLLAERLNQLSEVFERTAADPGTLDLVGDYLLVVDELRDTYFKYWQLDEDSNASERERLGNEIKSLIMQRENIREKIISRVADSEMRQAGHDHVYEVQWIYRRMEVDGFSGESIQALAEAARIVADQALERSEKLLENDAGSIQDQ